MYRSSESLFISWERTIISGMISLLQGLAILLTFGIYTPEWDIKYVFHCSKKDMEKSIGE